MSSINLKYINSSSQDITVSDEADFPTHNTMQRKAVLRNSALAAGKLMTVFEDLRMTEAGWWLDRTQNNHDEAVRRIIESRNLDNPEAEIEDRLEARIDRDDFLAYQLRFRGTAVTEPNRDDVLTKEVRAILLKETFDFVTDREVQLIQKAFWRNDSGSGETHRRHAEKYCEWYLDIRNWYLVQLEEEFDGVGPQVEVVLSWHTEQQRQLQEAGGSTSVDKQRQIQKVAGGGSVGTYGRYGCREPRKTSTTTRDESATSVKDQRDESDKAFDPRRGGRHISREIDVARLRSTFTHFSIREANWWLEHTGNDMDGTTTRIRAVNALARPAKERGESLQPAELARARMDRDHFYAAMLPMWEDAFLDVFRTAFPGMENQAILDIQERFVQARGESGEAVRWNAALALDWYLDRQEALKQDAASAHETGPELTEAQQSWIRTFIDFTGSTFDSAREHGARCKYGDMHRAVDGYHLEVDPLENTPPLVRSWSEEAVVGRDGTPGLPDSTTQPTVITQPDSAQIAAWTQGVTAMYGTGADVEAVEPILRDQQRSPDDAPKSETALAVEANQRKIEQLQAEITFSRRSAAANLIRFRGLGMLRRRRQEGRFGNERNAGEDERVDGKMRDRDGNDGDRDAGFGGDGAQDPAETLAEGVQAEDHSAASGNDGASDGGTHAESVKSEGAQSRMEDDD